MRRPPVLWLIGFLMLGFYVAFGMPVARGGATGVPGIAGSPVPVRTPQPLVRPPDVPVPTVDVAGDPLAQRALAHARREIRLKSGAITTRLSRPTTPEELRALGFGSWNFTPSCVPPLHLVILQGDFDVRPAMPSALPPGQEIPAAFVVYVYDLRIDNWIGLFGDPTGGQVKQVLGDPRLPDADPAALARPEHPVPVPCAPVEVPGAPAPPPAATSTP
jgi:hypothetical protein